jgi:hypothetical protein
MTDEERVAKINEKALAKLETYLEKLETGEMTPEDMLAIAYSAMVAVSAIGYSLPAIAEDALRAAEALRELSHDDDAVENN